MSKNMNRAMNKNKNSHAAEADAAARRSPANYRCRILVVDQNSDLRVLYADALAGPGCRVDVAEDGAAAWAALQAHRYHLLLTENELPNLTGEELIKKLRSARMDLPVVIVAGNLPAEEPARNPSLPCAATLLKPFALDALRDTVKNILRPNVPVRQWPLVLPNAIHGTEGKQAREALRHFPDKAAPSIAVTLSVRGTCDYCQDGANFATLERGHVLKQGAIVRTGRDARTDLLLRRTGTTVRLQADTEIKLEKMALTIEEGLPIVHTLLALHTGKLFTVVHAAVAGSTLEIRNAGGCSAAEGSGVSKCIITADGTHVWAQGSAIPIKIRGENGSTIIAAGRHLAAKDGAALPVSANLWMQDLSPLEELQAVMETYAAEDPPPKI